YCRASPLPDLAGLPFGVTYLSLLFEAKDRVIHCEESNDRGTRSTRLCAEAALALLLTAAIVVAGDRWCAPLTDVFVLLLRGIVRGVRFLKKPVVEDERVGTLRRALPRLARLIAASGPGERSERGEPECRPELRAIVADD